MITPTIPAVGGGVSQHELPDPVKFPIDRVPVAMIGQGGAWFSLEKDGDGVIVQPRQPLPCRCMIRAAALFQQDRGRDRAFPDVNMVMGRLCFARGGTDAQRFVPYTLDPQRRLKELFLPVETAPEDDWPVSVTRWRNAQAIAKRLLAAADVTWSGLSPDEIDTLVDNVVWSEPLEGCLLHALTQWTQDRGECVIEIGSFRGRSISMLALALRATNSPAKIISIDPHHDQPTNAEHVRLAMGQLGESKRLVQFPGESDVAWRLLRPGCASLVFVDGKHSYDQVVADFEHYKDILAPGGCMVFHDYGYGNHNGRPEADPEVRPAIDKHVMACEAFKPLLLAHTQFSFFKLS